MPWTNDIPDDLRMRLEPVLSQRGVGAPEVWATLKEFLEKVGAQPPEGLSAFSAVWAVNERSGQCSD